MLSLQSTSCFPVAASTPNSTAGAAMNSLTSLGTLQGLAGATVGLNNINALAGTINSEYLLLWWTAFPQILHRKWSAGSDLKGIRNGRTKTWDGRAHALIGRRCLGSLCLKRKRKTQPLPTPFFLICDMCSSIQRFLWLAVLQVSRSPVWFWICDVLRQC